MVGRFAPSPSGRMHLGNVFSCMLAWLSARGQGGRVVLRMEDLDVQRCRRAYAEELAEDLAWLGLTWDEGPFYQSQRTALYRAALQRLRDRVYPCYCTRAELHAASAPHRSDGQVVYPGTCRHLSPADAPDRPAALRLRVPAETIEVRDGHLGLYREDLERECGDFLLRRSDGVYAYQLAVVVDDADMGVTEVVRGSDLLSSTPRQLLLYRLLDLEPPRFFHVPLLLAPDGRRLSKRDADAGMDVLRERWSAAELLGKLGYLAGLTPTAEPKTAAELAADFDWDKVPRADITLPPDLF